jgi:hypothetical protein
VYWHVFFKYWHVVQVRAFGSLWQAYGENSPRMPLQSRRMGYYYTKLAFCLFTLLLLTDALKAQVTNDDTYDLRIDVAGRNFGYKFDGPFSGDDEITTLYSVNSNVGMLVQNRCEPWTGKGDWWNTSRWNLGVWQNTTVTQVSFGVMHWEDDNGSRCVYNDGDDGLNSVGQLEQYCNYCPRDGTYYINGDMMGRAQRKNLGLRHGDDGFSNMAQYQFDVAWAYAHGSERDDPLIFGDLRAGQTLSHFNSTNGYYEIGADDGEQFYRFNIYETLEVVVSTDNAQTGRGDDIDTKLTLYGPDGQYLAGNDDAHGGTFNSTISRRLCPGVYLVEVESFGSNEGNFNLTVSATAAADPAMPAELPTDKWLATTFDHTYGGSYHPSFRRSGYFYTAGEVINTQRDLYGTTADYANTPGFQRLTDACGSGSSTSGDRFFHIYRRSVPGCGAYAIDIGYFDDAVSVVVDGETVWQSTGCCVTGGRVWRGSLTEESVVEIKHTEYGGAATLEAELVRIDGDASATEWSGHISLNGNYLGYATPVRDGNRWRLTYPSSTAASIGDYSADPDGRYYENYFGCYAGKEKFKLRINKTGWTAGFYQVYKTSSKLSSDDTPRSETTDADFYINDRLVHRQYTGFNSPSDYYYTVLDPSDTVEFRSSSIDFMISWDGSLSSNYDNHYFDVYAQSPTLTASANKQEVYACSPNQVTLTGGWDQHFNGTRWEWEKSTDGGVSWVSIPNSNSYRVTANNLTETTQFRFRVLTAAKGTHLKTSPAVTVNVREGEALDVTQDGNAWGNGNWLTMVYGTDTWTDPAGTAQLNSMHVNLEQLMGSASEAPQQLPAYTGCDRDADYWSLRMRRRNFSPGDYRLSLGYGLDDDFYFLHDANADGVWEDSIYVNGWTWRNFQAPSPGARFSQQLTLTANSRVEVRFVDRTGAARMDMRLDPVPQLTLATDRSQLSHCDNQTAEVTLTHDHPGGDYELRWFDWRNDAAHRLTDQQGTSRTVHPAGETQWYRVEAWADDGTLLSQSAWLAVETLDGLTEDPASATDFGGSGEWSMATYNDLKMQQPRARARHAGEGFRLRDFTDAQGSPANLPNYDGCTTDPTDGWSLRMRRSGFTTGILSIYLEVGPADEDLLWRIDDDGDGNYEEEISLRSGGKSAESDSRYLERAVGPATVVDVNWRSRSNTNGLRMEYGEAAAALPVELTDFSATAEGSVNVLRWTTQSERDNDRFLIERAAPEGDFATIGELPGAGDANAPTDYAFTDDRPLGLAYYRLRQVDFDGTETLSEVVTVRRPADTDVPPLEVFPNPVGGDWLQLVSGRAGQLRIVHASGRVVHQRKVAAGTTRLEIGELPPGTYWIDLEGKRGRQQVKFIRR